MVNWFSTRAPRQFNGKSIVLSTNDAGTTGHIHAKKKNDLDYFMPDTKINSKLIINENATAKHVKFLGKKIGVNLHVLMLDNDFLIKHQKHKQQILLIFKTIVFLD